MKEKGEKIQSSKAEIEEEVVETKEEGENDENLLDTPLGSIKRKPEESKSEKAQNNTSNGTEKNPAKKLKKGKQDSKGDSSQKPKEPKTIPASQICPTEKSANDNGLLFIRNFRFHKPYLPVFPAIPNIKSSPEWKAQIPPQVIANLTKMVFQLQYNLNF
jgi:hypothetical protein